MLDVLHNLEKTLPELLKKPEKWHSLFINYHPPFVERLWHQAGEYRICLHRISSCASKEALFHTHPWASAIRVLRGTYEMGVGYTKNSGPPPVAAKIMLQAGNTYEMTDPNGWHYVRPLTDNTLSVMVIGQPWKPERSRKRLNFQPLSGTAVRELLCEFSAFY